MILKTYVLPAAEGKEADLLRALRALSDAVIAAGAESVDLLRDANAAGCFVFIERWESLGRYESASNAVPKILFGPVMAALSAPPSTRTLLPAEQ